MSNECQKIAIPVLQKVLHKLGCKTPLREQSTYSFFFLSLKNR